MNGYRNTLLSHLDSDIIDRLHLRRVNFALLQEIEFPGSPINHLFFIEEGMASMTATFEDGSQVETSTFGYESVIGVSALMGTKRSLNRVYTQIEGWGYSAPVEAARKEFMLGGAFQALTLRYVQAQLLQSGQSAGCNAKHGIEQRFARWILVCADRTHTKILKLSHELIADMLGTRRPTISTVAAEFREQGIIAYTRGTIKILDMEGLRQKACECYKVIKEHLDNYAEFDTDFVG